MTDQWNRVPELTPVWNIPIWFHHRGYKMRPDERSDELKLLAIAGSAAVLKISKDEAPEYWKLEWHIRHSKNTGASGTILFPEKLMVIAFGLETADVPEYGRWLIERYGGDYACQGQFIRWREFLNIPGPGTGHDGDPNISIAVDDEIKKAVANLLKR